MATIGGVEIVIPGFYFKPTEKDLVMHYLMKKFLKQPYHANVILKHDVYSTEPWNLPKNFPNPANGKNYYFTYVKRLGTKNTRLVRRAGNGYWHMNGANKKIYDDDGLEIGSTIALTYMNHSDGIIMKTNWVMHEYRLHMSFFKRSLKKNTELVLCDIQESGKVSEPKRTFEDHDHTSDKRRRTSIMENECIESEEPKQFDQTSSLVSENTVSPFGPSTSYGRSELTDYPDTMSWLSMVSLDDNLMTEDILATPTTLIEHAPDANDFTFKTTKEEDDKFSMLSPTEEVIREFLIEECNQMNRPELALGTGK